MDPNSSSPNILFHQTAGHLQKIREEIDCRQKLGKLGIHQFTYVSGLLFKVDQLEEELGALKMLPENSSSKEKLNQLADSVHALYPKFEKIAKIRALAVAHFETNRRLRSSEDVWDELTMDLGKGSRKYYVKMGSDGLAIVSAKFTDIKLKTELGQGTFGIVYGHEKGEQISAVAKVPKLETVNDDFESKDPELYKLELESQIKQLQNERKVVKELGPCPGIIPIPKAFVKTADNKAILVAKRFTCDLEQALRQNSLSNAEIYVGLGNMFRALAFMHRKGIVHRDIKPENTAYFSDSKDDPLRIADFGGAGKAKEILSKREGILVSVSPDYFPLELVNAESEHVDNPESEMNYAAKHDCYSLARVAIYTFLPNLNEIQIHDLFNYKEYDGYIVDLNLPSTQIKEFRLKQLLNKSLKPEVIDLLVEIFNACKVEAPPILPKTIEAWGHRLAALNGETLPPIVPNNQGLIEEGAIVSAPFNFIKIIPEALVRPIIGESMFNRIISIAAKIFRLFQ